MFSKEEKKILRLTFWGSFNAMSARRRQAEGKPREWMLKRSGVKGLSLRFDLDREHAAVGFEIWRKDKFEEALMFEKLESLRNMMEGIIDKDIIWNDEFVTTEGRQCSRIYVRLDNVDMYQKEDWPEIQEFFFVYMSKFESILLEFKDILR
ncbi:MAG: DUF4268 domain-containing protein [Bacteroidales bacterium]